MSQPHTINVLPEDVTFDCADGASLLIGMERRGVGRDLVECIPVGCRGGGCGVCRVRILAGEYESKKMSIKHVTPEERDAGIALACRVFPAGSMQIEVLANPSG